MRRTRPPYRADHVGSLLRSAPLKQARAKRERGEIPAGALREIEDREIENIVRRQEQIGLKLATDGEYRRSWWHFDFLEKLDGVEGFVPEHGIQFHGVETKPKAVRVVGKIGFSDHPMLEHFRFLKARTHVQPKMTIPSPSVLHFRSGRNGISKKIYPDIEQFFDDLAETYRKAVRAFADAGCRYLQLDDTVWAYLCSAQQREEARQRGDDPRSLPASYARVINQAIAGRPSDMVITTHSCRGNFRSTWIAEGGYEPVAEMLLGQVNYDGYFLEYDTERAGGFEPLRFLPKGNKIAVLGLVTSKTGTLEQKDDVKRRIEEATKYVDLDQLCLSPQCGFASTEEGNILAEDEQWAKLGMIVELAEEVWG
ncbi:MAG TPA: cobalamin-independent methionine synthase II family protein [Xanthobacteraceae bacterium]